MIIIIELYFRNFFHMFHFFSYYLLFQFPMWSENVRFYKCMQAILWVVYLLNIVFKQWKWKYVRRSQFTQINIRNNEMHQPAGGDVRSINVKFIIVIVILILNYTWKSMGKANKKTPFYLHDNSKWKIHTQKSTRICSLFNIPLLKICRKYVQLIERWGCMTCQFFVKPN